MEKKTFHSHLISLGFFFIISFFGASSAFAESEEPKLPEISLSQFRTAGVGLITTRQSAPTLSVDWNPEWNLAPNWNLGLNLGIIPFSSLTPNSLGFEYQLTLGRMLFSSIWFEVGGGAQSWTNGGSTAALISGTFYYRFPDTYLGILDRAFMSYSSFLVSNLYTSEIKLGFGVTF